VKLIAAVLAALMPAVALAGGFECLMEPSQVVELRASVDGQIAAVHVQRADVLRKGQVLVELESAAERVAVESANYRAQMTGQVATAGTRLEFANKKLSRMIDLEQKQFISPQARDEAETERSLAENELQVAIESRELAKIELRRAQEQLALRTLSSPFNGVVVDRMLNPGDLAESGSGRKPVLKIAQIDPLKVDVVLPGALYGRVKVGQMASVVAAVGGTRYEARVKIVDRVIDAASGTFVVRLELPNPQLRLPIGSRCTAQFDGVAAPGTKP
jgi:RND family efflux transporter MFP subunit